MSRSSSAGPHGLSRDTRDRSSFVVAASRRYRVPSVAPWSDMRNMST